MTTTKLKFKHKEYTIDKVVNNLLRYYDLATHEEISQGENKYVSEIFNRSIKRITMDLDHIRKILDSPLHEDDKPDYILSVIANDKKAISYVLQMIQEQRENSDELISEMNLELSRADMALENIRYIYAEDNKDETRLAFVRGEINKFYDKWTGFVRHCFPKRNKDK